MVKEGPSGRNANNLNIQQAHTKVGKVRDGNEWRGLSFTISEEDMKWLQGSYVGQTFNVECTLSIQDNLHMAGVFTIKAIPFGGKLCVTVA